MLVNIASDDAWILGVLSSRAHVTWALAAGGTLEDRPRYNKTRCFEPFPFPAATAAQQARIRALGEQLDAHRKARQALHPELTLTGMYNVLEKLRALDRQACTRTESGVEPPAVQSLASRPAQSGTEPQRQRDSLDCLRLDAAIPTQRSAQHSLPDGALALTPKERQIHELGLVTVLRELHDELDRAVLDAYGWPHDLDGQGLLQRLVDLNAARDRPARRAVTGVADVRAHLLTLDKAELVERLLASAGHAGEQIDALKLEACLARQGRTERFGEWLTDTLAAPAGQLQPELRAGGGRPMPFTRRRRATDPETPRGRVWRSWQVGAGTLS